MYSVGRKKIRHRSSRNTWWRSKPLIIQGTGVVSHAKNKKQHKDSSSCIGCDCISIFCNESILFWLFVELGDTNPIKYFFVYIANPMTVGAYCAGVAMIVRFMAFRSILGRLLIAVPYFFLLMISCIAIMGMTGWCDLLMYVPHIIIIGLTIFIATRQLAYENKSDTQNENGNI